jgi:hypothetical protein
MAVGEAMGVVTIGGILLATEVCGPCEPSKLVL